MHKRALAMLGQLEGQPGTESRADNALLVKRRAAETPPPTDTLKIDVLGWGNAHTVQLDKRVKNVTLVRMQGLILPCAVNPINANNNTIYFTEVYAATYDPTLFRAQVPPGNYTGASLAIVLEHAMAAAVPVEPLTTYPAAHVPNPAGRPVGVYSARFDATTGRLALACGDGADEGFVLHGAPGFPWNGGRALAQQGAFEAASVGFGISAGGFTPVFVSLVTAPSGHNLTTFSVVQVSIQDRANRARIVRVDKLLLTEAVNPASSDLRFSLPDVQAALFQDSLPGDLYALVTPVAWENNIALTLGYTATPHGALVLAGAHGTPVPILHFQATGGANQYRFVLGGPHFATPGTSTLALVPGGEVLQVDSAPSSSVLVATGAAPIASTPSAVKLRAPGAAFDQQTIMPAKLDLTLTSRVVYVEVVLGEVAAGTITTSSPLKRRYLARVPSEVGPNEVMFYSSGSDAANQDTFATPIPGFNKITIRLYDATEGALDYSGARWSCYLEFASDDA